MAELKLIRKRMDDQCTEGELYLNGELQCQTLEDVVRAPGVKVDGKTAIPAGRYPVVVDYSFHFKKYMFHILNVPMFVGIRIHSGNVATDTEGCVLVGEIAKKDMILNSRKALDALWAKLTKSGGWDFEHGIPHAAIAEETWIEVVNEEGSCTQ